MELILCYHDIFEGEMPDLEKEIKDLNMHKAISIVYELIKARNYSISVKTESIVKIEMEVPFEIVLKRTLCEIDAASPEEMFSNPLLTKKKHIFSFQMLLILLKKIMIYGDYSTMKENSYEISINDYRKIVQLELIVAEKINDEFHEDTVDINHFLYGTYHLNYDRSVANEFYGRSICSKRLAGISITLIKIFRASIRITIIPF